MTEYPNMALKNLDAVLLTLTECSDIYCANRCETMASCGASMFNAADGKCSLARDYCLIIGNVSNSFVRVKAGGKLLFF